MSAYKAPLTCPLCGGQPEHRDVIECTPRRSSATFACATCGALWGLIATLVMVAPPKPTEAAA